MLCNDSLTIYYFGMRRTMTISMTKDIKAARKANNLNGNKKDK